jgi:hypothetical protein
VVLACVLVGTAWFTVAVLSAFNGQPPPGTGAGPRPAASADDTEADGTSSSDPASSASSGTTGSTRPGVTLVARRIEAAATTMGLLPGSPTVTTARISHPDVVTPTTGVTTTTGEPVPTTTIADQPAPLPSTPEPTRPTR